MPHDLPIFLPSACFTNRREREFHLGGLCDACDRTLSLEEDESLSLHCVLRITRRLAKKSYGVVDRMPQVRIARSVGRGRPLQRSLSLGLAREFATEGAREKDRGGIVS